jgi:perosamine synthetase
MFPVNKPSITHQDIEAVSEVLRQGWISGEGPIVQEFETKFAAFVNREFGIAVSNGSVALELVFDVLDLPEGSEVILPSFAIISCLAPILRQNLKPVFVDANPVTWNVDLDNIYKAVTPNTSAIMAVHVYGLGIPLTELSNFCKEQGIFLIEDAAEAHGVIVEGKKCGSFGDISTFSFYANKLVTSGEGGMVLTNDGHLSERLRSLRNLAFRKDQRFVHDELGFNYRLSSLQASLGISQLARIGESVQHRMNIADIYQKNLRHQHLFTFQPAKTEFSTNIYWVVGILLNANAARFKHAIIKSLEDNGVQTRPFFYPLHQQPVLEKFGISTSSKFPISENLYENGFYLPSGNGYLIEEIHSICKIFNEVLDLIFPEGNDRN